MKPSQRSQPLNPPLWGRTYSRYQVLSLSFAFALLNPALTLPVFFIIFRETLETSIVVGILLSFIKHTVGSDPVLYKRLVRQVWAGTIAGLLVCLVVGAGIIGAFYSLQKRNLWSKSEDLYEGTFSLLASIIITLMGAVILRIGKMQDNWRAKVMADGEKGIAATSKRYAMFILPLVTVLREGVEAVVFVGGIGLSEPASAFPLPVIAALLAGSTIGWMVYRGGATVGVKWFLIASTVVLYLVAAGLLSKAAWSFDMYEVYTQPASPLLYAYADPAPVC